MRVLARYVLGKQLHLKSRLVSRAVAGEGVKSLTPSKNFLFPSFYSK